MPKVKGSAKTGGRTKGTPNKITRVVRETLAQVFDQLQDDPKNNLLQWAKGNPTEFYKLSSKLIPDQYAHTDKDGNDKEVHTIIIKKK